MAGPADGGANPRTADGGALGSRYAPVPDPAAVEARCTAKALHAEGIPMVLALEDCAGGDPPGPAGPGDPGGVTAQTGAALADLVHTYRAALRPDAADDDYWAVHDVLVVTADAHGPATPDGRR